MASASEIFGDAAAGAGIGSSFGPIGTGVGAIIGGLGGALFGDKPQVPAYRDMTDPTISTTVQQMLRKKLGALQANRQRTLNERNAQMENERVANDPSTSRSEGAKIAAYNQIGTGAEERNVQANLGGAQQDQEAQVRAAQLTEANQKLSMERNQFARQGFQLNQQPSAFQTLLSSGLGQALGSALAPKVTPPTGDSSGAITTPMPAYTPPSQSVPDVAAPMSFGDISRPPVANGTVTNQPWDENWAPGQGTAPSSYQPQYPSWP